SSPHHRLACFPTRRSSDLSFGVTKAPAFSRRSGENRRLFLRRGVSFYDPERIFQPGSKGGRGLLRRDRLGLPAVGGQGVRLRGRSEEHTSELQSRIELVCR